jgi:hypothetical protein
MVDESLVVVEQSLLRLDYRVVKPLHGAMETRVEAGRPRVCLKLDGRGAL